MRKSIILLLLLLTSIMPFSYHRPAVAESPPKIVFDYSHGQYHSVLTEGEPNPGPDWYLRSNLSTMGYEVVWAFGGLNKSILSGADALIVGSIYGESNGFTQSEIDAVSDWFNSGSRFLWVGSDSDYGGTTYINSNMSWMLEAAGSHVYPEPTAIEDEDSNCQASYRAVATGTTNNSYFADIVADVSAVLMHGPTCLYGSTSAIAGENALALETERINNVYPLLYYGDGAYITDSDLTPPVAHNNGDSGPFVAMSIETNAGEAGSGLIAVSGASPYSDYMPMYVSEYYTCQLDGYNLVKQTIEWAIKTEPPTITSPDDIHYELGTTGNNITWNASDTDPDYYEVYRNGSLIDSGQWNGGLISVNVDGLDAGVYNYTLILSDTQGNNVTDCVLVIVSPRDTPAWIDVLLANTGLIVTAVSLAVILYLTPKILQARRIME